MKRDQFTIPKQWMSGDHITPSEIRIDGIAILQPFYKQLEDDIFANLLKQFGPLDLAAKS